MVNTRPVLGSATTTLPLYGPRAATAARLTVRSSPSMTSPTVESANVGSSQGPLLMCEAPGSKAVPEVFLYFGVFRLRNALAAFGGLVAGFATTGVDFALFRAFVAPNEGGIRHKLNIMSRMRREE